MWGAKKSGLIISELQLDSWKIAKDDAVHGDGEPHLDPLHVPWGRQEEELKRD